MEDASNNIEIVDVTNVTGDTFTIVRAQEGTIGLAYLSGDSVQLRVTKEVLDSLAQIVDAVMRSGAAIKTAGDLTFNDNVQINLGTALDGELYSTGAVINLDINGGLQLIFRDGNSGNANRFTFDIDTGALTITGNASVLNNIVNGELILNAGYSEDADSYTVTTGAKALNLAAATYFFPDNPMTAVAVNFTFSNPAASGRVSSFTLELNNMIANTNATPWPASVEWTDGAEPFWSAGIDIVSFVTRDGGTTWRGFNGGTNFS